MATDTAALFPPFPFGSRPVPTATDTFDFEQWRREPTGPVILKGALADWPIVRELQRRRSDSERLDYLSSEFGENMVGHTRVPASDPFMGYDDNGVQNFKYAPRAAR
jgi:hypothetical protein